MTGFEPRTSGIGSDRSTNWATTTAEVSCDGKNLHLCGDNAAMVCRTLQPFREVSIQAAVNLKQFKFNILDQISLAVWSEG